MKSIFPLLGIFSVFASKCVYQFQTNKSVDTKAKGFATLLWPFGEFVTGKVPENSLLPLLSESFSLCQVNRKVLPPGKLVMRINSVYAGHFLPSFKSCTNICFPLFHEFLLLSSCVAGPDLEEGMDIPQGANTSINILKRQH